MNTTNYNILTDTVHWLAMTRFNCCEKFTFTNQGHECTSSVALKKTKVYVYFRFSPIHTWSKIYIYAQIHTYSQVVKYMVLKVLQCLDRAELYYIFVSNCNSLQRVLSFWSIKRISPNSPKNSVKLRRRMRI